MREIPPPTKIKSSIERYKRECAKEFFQYNMERIISVLEDFVERPGEIYRKEKVWFYIYEVGEIHLEKDREHIFKKELDLIIDNLKEKGYNCHINVRDKYYQRLSYTHREDKRKIVTLDLNLDFNKDEKKNTFWSKLFRKG